MLLIWLAIFYLGAIFGSFIHVVVSRSLKGQTWIKGRSCCDHCRKQIAWFDNIPLLSFFLLGGKCRYCNKPIDKLHFVAELGGGLIMLWWWALAGQCLTGQFLPWTLLVATIWFLVGLICLIIVLADLKEMIIPDKASLSLLVLAGVYLGAKWWQGESEFVFNAWLSFLATGVLFVLLFVLTKGKGMGFGDVKLAPVLSLMLGWPAALVGLFTAVLSGSLVGIALLLAGKHKRRQPIAFGPFLILGFLFATLYGEMIWRWYWTLVF